MFKSCAYAMVMPWLVGIPLAFLLALIAPRFIHVKERPTTGSPRQPPVAAHRPTLP